MQLSDNKNDCLDVLAQTYRYDIVRKLFQDLETTNRISCRSNIGGFTPYQKVIELIITPEIITNYFFERFSETELAQSMENRGVFKTINNDISNQYSRYLYQFLLTVLDPKIAEYLNSDIVKGV